MSSNCLHVHLNNINYFVIIFSCSLNGRKMLWLAKGWKLHISSLYRQGSTMYNGIYNKPTDRSSSGLQVSLAEIYLYNTQSYSIFSNNLL